LDTDFIYKIKNIKKSFSKDSGTNIPTLQFKDLFVRRGSMTIITGETGIGKTTLLNMLGLMDEIEFYDNDDIFFIPEPNHPFISYKELYQNSPEEIENIRFEYFGFMFQQDHLIDSMTGWENVILPCLLRYPGISVQEAALRAKNIIRDCKFNDMLDGLMNRSPSTFSGGQRQRAALIRALIHDPIAIFADEPLASVDYNTALEIIRILYKQTLYGKTIIMVVHDTHEVMFENIEVEKIHLTKRFFQNTKRRGE